ncbi:hypothetical protein [Arsenicibacter rosenii]|uniref:Uncharacterized protein n=1 Tax=Arsenicibacter rosenii TaxID=1750698 RepID=A0A1S2VRH8_9BACT|nr:hypothetical protein [Arsenicibacter rosenii]OIN61070.1 hypothetical protein BLX24_03095 [Arsenicibacter rosenii]
MKTVVSQQISDYHLLHRIWQSELRTAEQQLGVYRDMLDAVNNPQAARQSARLADEIDHYKRLVPEILHEMHDVDVEMVVAIRNQERMDQETRKDQRYLQEKMDDFDANYQRFRQQIRRFLAETLIHPL